MCREDLRGDSYGRRVVIEMEALVSGRLVEIVHEADTEVAVEEIIGYLDDGA